MKKLLVVEDEKHIAQGLRFNLEAEGYKVELLDNGEDALKRLNDGGGDLDLLVLDVMLPGIDGFTVATELRRAQNFIPLLMLTARGRPEDVIKGFESGADDYLPKPFSLDILLARIGGLLRRKKWLLEQPAPPEPSSPADKFFFSGKTVDFDKLLLSNGPNSFQLTLMEMELLRYLIRNSGRPVTRKEILQKVWNLDEDTDTRAIDNFVVRLRRYIEADATKPQHLITVRGLGYQFVPEPEPSNARK
jgi:two-component system, OmpR family, alkaline phosphatase synthesis response regulator PhoP